MNALVSPTAVTFATCLGQVVFLVLLFVAAERAIAPKLIPLKTLLRRPRR